MKICKVDECASKYFAKGYCKNHYQYNRDHGYPVPKSRPREKHHMSETSEYSSWRCMVSRCSNKNDSRYSYYGGRGITVWGRWKHSFRAFYADMGDKPTIKHQIDRIDNNGNYEPGNCRWVTSAENSRNTRATIVDMDTARSIRIIRKSTSLPYSKIAKLFNVKPTLITDICLNRSWREEK